MVDSRNILRVSMRHAACILLTSQQLSTPAADGRPSEAQRQVACADLILLNKTDLVTAAQLAEVNSRIHALNATLRIHETQQSRVRMNALFNIRAFSAHPEELSSFQTVHQQEANGYGAEHEHGEDHDHDHDKHEHPPEHGDIATVLIPLPTLTMAQFDKLNDFLETFLWSRLLPNGQAGPDVLRTKGYFRRVDGTEWIVQGVTDMFELKQLDSNKSKGGVEVDGKIVFIGRGVSEALQRTLLEHIA